MLNILLLATLLVLAADVAPSGAEDEPYPLNMISHFMNTITRQRNIMVCMVNSCDPFVLHKIFDIEDGIEQSVKTKPNFPESNEFMTTKVFAALDKAVERLMILEPNCVDHTYICPHPVSAELPEEIFEFIRLLERIIATRKCINMNNAYDAINSFGNGVAYTETIPEIGDDHFTKRVIVPGTYVAVQFEKLCKRE
uniref:Uncharacterized protein n=1 Tax=Stomoxys calcitrans TaxID=35570 RepID=A0A1I8PID7_STOCA